MKYAKLFRVKPGAKIDLKKIDPDFTDEQSRPDHVGRAGADQ